MDCPKCDAELEYEGADPSVGIFGSGYYCDECDEFYDDAYEPSADDVPISFASGRKDIGTPISKLSGRVGEPGFNQFAKFARSWGYD